MNGYRPAPIGRLSNHATFTSQEVIDGVIGSISLNREGTPDDVANAVQYLAMEQVAFITGEVMNIHGGAYFA